MKFTMIFTTCIPILIIGDCLLHLTHTVFISHIQYSIAQSARAGKKTDEQNCHVKIEGNAKFSYE